MRSDNKINFLNNADIGYILETILNLLSTQEGWDTEFNVSTVLKERQH